MKLDNQQDTGTCIAFTSTRPAITRATAYTSNYELRDLYSKNYYFLTDAYKPRTHTFLRQDHWCEKGMCKRTFRPSSSKC